MVKCGSLTGNALHGHTASQTCLHISENVNDLFVVIDYCFVVIIFLKAVNKQHPSNEELLSMAEFFKGELLGFDHLPRYHLVSDVSPPLGLLQELVARLASQEH